MTGLTIQVNITILMFLTHIWDGKFNDIIGQFHDHGPQVPLSEKNIKIIGSICYRFCPAASGIIGVIIYDTDSNPFETLFMFIWMPSASVSDQTLP